MLDPVAHIVEVQAGHLVEVHETPRGQIARIAITQVNQEGHRYGMVEALVNRQQLDALVEAFGKIRFDLPEPVSGEKEGGALPDAATMRALEYALDEGRRLEREGVMPAAADPE